MSDRHAGQAQCTANSTFGEKATGMDDPKNAAEAYLKREPCIHLPKWNVNLPTSQ